MHTEVILVLLFLIFLKLAIRANRRAAVQPVKTRTSRKRSQKRSTRATRRSLPHVPPFSEPIFQTVPYIYARESVDSVPDDYR